MFSEFVGITQEVASSIESRRLDPTETKNDILRRILELCDPTACDQPVPNIDLGQGVEVAVGESLYLYLRKPKSPKHQPDGIAEVRGDGLYIDSEKVQPSKGSVVTPAMHIFQRRQGHFNPAGNLISLSAYRQFYIKKDGRLVRLDDLKDPQKARHRRSNIAMMELIDKIDFEL